MNADKPITSAEHSEGGDGSMLPIDPASGRTNPRGRTTIVQAKREAAKPPLDLHESVVSKYFAREPITGKIVPDAALSKAGQVMGEATAMAEQAAASFTDICRDPRFTKTQAMARAGQSVNTLTDKAMGKIGDAQNVIEEALHQSLNANTYPSAAKVNAAYAAEIRSVLRELSPDKRSAVISQAITDNDEQVLAAVLGGHGFLIGETAESRESRIAEYRQKKYPAAFEREARLKKARAAIERARNALRGWRAKTLNDSDIAKAVREANAARHAALAADRAADNPLNHTENE